MHTQPPLRRTNKARRSDYYRPALLWLEDRTLPGDTVLGVLAAQAGLAQSRQPESTSVPLVAAHTSGVHGQAFEWTADRPAGAMAVVTTAWEYALPAGALDADLQTSPATNRPTKRQLPSLAGSGEMRAGPLPEPTMIPPPAATPMPAPAAAGWGAASSHGLLEQVVAATPASRGETPGVTSHEPWCGNPVPQRTSPWNTYQHDIHHTGRTEAAIDPAALNLAWQAPRGYSIPIIVGDNVISMKNQQGIGNDMTLVSSFRLADGAINWTYSNRFTFPGHPTYAEGLVVYAAKEFSSSELRLYVHDATDGALKYIVPIDNFGGTAVMPTIHRNTTTGNLVAYVARHDYLWAVNLGASAGSILWRGSGDFGGFSIPTIVGDSVVVTGPGQFYAFDQTTGARNHFHQGSIFGGGGTTVAYDATWRLLYVLEAYSSSQFNTLTAYYYHDNATIMQLWQKTGPGIRRGGSVAIGPDSKVYAVDNTTLVELDPYDGSALRSLTGLNLANAVTPAISNGYLWVYSNNATLIYDLTSLTLARSLPGSRGSLNSAFDGPGALSDGLFALDYGNIYDSAGFQVYSHYVFRQDPWATYQHDVYHTGCSGAWIDPVALNLAWSAPQGYAIPLIVGDSIYAMRNQGGAGDDMTSVSSFNLHTGAVNWTYTNRFVFPGHPTYAEGLIVFAATAFPPTNPWDLYVLDAFTGALKYTVRLHEGFNTGVMPTIHRDSVTGDLVAYVATGGMLQAVRLGATSGSILWTETGSFGGFSIPTVVGNSVVLAGPGQYYAFDMTTGARNHFHQGNISGGGGTTVAYDPTWRLFYVLEFYNTDQFAVLTAYYYHDNATIVQLWQRTGPGIRSGGSVAIGPYSQVYAVDNTTLVELNPYDGSTMRSLGGQVFATGVAPAIAGNYLWAYSEGHTFIYNLSTFTHVRTLTGARGGNLNSAYDGPGAITDGYFALDYGNIYGRPGFDVYRSF